MAVPYTFGSATTSIPLSQLDSNFATTITLGNTAVQLGNTITNLTGVSNLASATSLSLGSNGNTTAITVDTSQNVGIGATPSAWSGYTALDIRTSMGSLAATGAGAGDVTLTQNAYYNGTNWIYKYTGGQAHRYSMTETYHAWFYAPIGTAGGTISFTEAMRIDNSGNLLVGTTNASDSAGNGAKVVTNSSVPGMFVVGNSASGSSLAFSCYSSSASNYKFYVDYAGLVHAVTTTITAISDQRLKENIRDLDDGLEKLLTLKPRKFDWKQGKGADIKNARGFIAQEFETVFPDMIENWRDPAPEGEEPYKAINANLIPTLVKAIQELKAINDTQAETINALTARIVALEAK